MVWLLFTSHFLTVHTCGCCYGCLFVVFSTLMVFSPKFVSWSLEFVLVRKLCWWQLCCCLYKEPVCNCFGNSISCRLKLPHHQQVMLIPWCAKLGCQMLNRNLPNLFFPLLKKQKSSRIYCSREDSWKLVPTSSLSLSCHNGVSKDKLLQPVNITEQKMQCSSISDFNNLWPNVLGFSELCWNELCFSLQNNNERNVEMWKNV